MLAQRCGAAPLDRADQFHGHVDSWHVGIGDNATGNATLLELARVFWQYRDRLARSLRIAWLLAALGAGAGARAGGGGAGVR